MLKVNAFTYKDGFHELPYLVNSPQEMIQGFKLMPLVKCDESNQSISARNQILNVVVYYREVEEGLFLIYSEVKFKSNVCFKHLFDSSKPLEYYCLSLRTDHYAKMSNSLANGIGYTDNSWLIFKPGAKVNHHHFKGTRGRYVSLYFNMKWIRKYMTEVSAREQKLLKLFFRSENDHLICPNLPGQEIFSTDQLCSNLLSGNPNSKKRLVSLKNEIHGFIRFFIFKMQSENIDERHFLVSNLERMKVLKARRIMKENVYSKFLGIDFLAQEVGLSQTKLKECFSAVYDETLYKYFRNMQMDDARQMISSSDTEIGLIARKFGYENASKFAIAFKGRHGVLPSGMRNHIN